jgi:hypothetical protein
LWIFASHRDDLGDLLRLEYTWSTWARLVSQHLLDQLSQALVIDPLFFCQQQSRCRRCPSLAPGARCASLDVQALGHLCIVGPIGCLQYNVAPAYEPLGVGLAACKPLKNLTLSYRQLD